MKKGLLKTFCIALLLELVIGSLNLAQAEEQSSSRRQRALRWENTWANSPRRRHTDTSTTAPRQAAFKKQCVAWEKRWLSVPRRRHTDSSPFQTASSAQNVK